MPKMTTGNLSPTAHDGWRLFARSRGVSVTALMEAIGRRLGDLDQPEAKLPPLLREAVAEAREIDDDRRRR